MPIEVLRCPTCSGNDNSRPDANGVHTCVYCGVRYRVTAGAVQTFGNPTTSQRRTLWAAAGALLAVGVIGVVVSLGRSASPVASSGSRVAPVEIAMPPITLPATPAPTPSEPTPSEPTPVVQVVPTAVEPAVEAPAVARFELESQRAVSDTIFYVVGWTYNDSPYSIDKTKVTAVMLDASGKEVASASGMSDDLIPAGAREPTEIIVLNAPEFASMTFEVSPRKATYIPTSVEGLRLEVGPVTSTFGTSLEVKGKVFHEGTVPARFVRIRALGFDAQDKLVGLFYTYADAERLEPATSARFNLYMNVPTPPKRWEFIVRASG